MPVSKSYAWLFSSVASPPAYRPSSSDYEGLASLLLGCWQILPITLPRFKAWVVGDGRGKALIDRAEARLIADGEVLNLQMMLLERLADALQLRGVPFVLLKSAATRLVAYPTPELRRARDIDIGVSSENLELAVEALSTIGFERAQWRDDLQLFERAEPELRSAVEKNHYELGFWVRLQEAVGLDVGVHQAIVRQRHECPAQWDLSNESKPAAYIVADVHHGLSLNISVDDLISSAVTTPYSNRMLPVPRQGWLFFHLVFKIYMEGISNYCEGAYQYADLCYLAPKMVDTELEFFADRIREFHLQAAGFYVLRRLPNDFGVSLSTTLADLVEEWVQPNVKSTPALENDWGDMWQKLWGIR